MYAGGAVSNAQLSGYFFCRQTFSKQKKNFGLPLTECQDTLVILHSQVYLAHEKLAYLGSAEESTLR
jgi:hypothetical protein